VLTLSEFLGQLAINKKPHRGWIFCALFQWEQYMVINSAPLHLYASYLAKEVRSLSGLEGPLPQNSPIYQCFDGRDIVDDSQRRQ
jgi:hypothetical protein